DDLAGETGPRARALVAAGLHHPLELRRRLAHRPALADGVGQRLLAIDVQPRLAGGDGGQGVPVVRGGDDDRVEPLVADQVTEVLVGGALLAAALLGELLGGAQVPLVHVADGDDLDVLLAGEAAEQAAALAAGADDADGDAVAGGRLVLVAKDGG